MPLNCHQERIGIGGFHRLHQSILGMSSHFESPSQTLDGLAVQAIHKATTFERLAEARFRVSQRNAVGWFRARCGLQVFTLDPCFQIQVLVKRSAELHVDHLKAAADAQYGQLATVRPIEEIKLKSIPFVVELEKFWVLDGFLIIPGVDVVPAAKQDTIVALTSGTEACDGETTSSSSGLTETAKSAL